VADNQFKLIGSERLPEGKPTVIAVARLSVLRCLIFALILAVLAFVVGVASGSSGLWRYVITSSTPRPDSTLGWLRNAFLIFDFTDQKKEPGIRSRLNLLEDRVDKAFNAYAGYAVHLQGFSGIMLDTETTAANASRDSQEARTASARTEQGLQDLIAAIQQAEATFKATPGQRSDRPLEEGLE